MKSEDAMNTIAQSPMTKHFSTKTGIDIDASNIKLTHFRNVTVTEFSEVYQDKQPILKRINRYGSSVDYQDIYSLTAVHDKRASQTRQKTSKPAPILEIKSLKRVGKIDLFTKNPKEKEEKPTVKKQFIRKRYKTEVSLASPARKRHKFQIRDLMKFAQQETKKKKLLKTLRKNIFSDAHISYVHSFT